METPEQHVEAVQKEQSRHWNDAITYCSGVSIVDFEQVNAG